MTHNRRVLFFNEIKLQLLESFANSLRRDENVAQFVFSMGGDNTQLLEDFILNDLFGKRILMSTIVYQLILNNMIYGLLFLVKENLIDYKLSQLEKLQLDLPFSETTVLKDLQAYDLETVKLRRAFIVSNLIN